MRTQFIDLKEIGTTIKLATPLVLGHVSAGLIGFIDNVIAGQHSTKTLAAVSIGTALLWLPMLIPIGTLLSLTSSVSQLYGSGEQQKIAPIFRQALWLALMLAIIMFLFLTLVPYGLEFFGIKAAVAEGAKEFLHSVRWGIFALSLFFCMRYLTEGMHYTIPTMLISLAGLIVLGPLGYVLTWGKLGFPELGAQGLGIASAVMMWVQAIIFAVYLYFSSRFSYLNLFTQFDLPNKEKIFTLLRTGLPIGFTILMEGGLFIITALLISRLGEVPGAAHQIAINVATLCFMVPMGIAEATTVRVGYAVGANDVLGVRRASWAGYFLVLISQLFSASILIFAHDSIVAIYTKDAVVAALASTLLLYAATFQFPDGIQIVSAGALRGLKDTKVPMFLAFLAYWGVGMPLGALLGLHYGWGPQGMWIGLIAGLLVAAIMMASRLAWSTKQLINNKVKININNTETIIKIN